MDENNCNNKIINKDKFVEPGEIKRILIDNTPDIPADCAVDASCAPNVDINYNNNNYNKINKLIINKPNKCYNNLILPLLNNILLNVDNIDSLGILHTKTTFCSKTCFEQVRKKQKEKVTI